MLINTCWQHPKSNWRALFWKQKKNFCKPHLTLILPVPQRCGAQPEWNSFQWCSNVTGFVGFYFTKLSVNIRLHSSCFTASFILIWAMKHGVTEFVASPSTCWVFDGDIVCSWWRTSCCTSCFFLPIIGNLRDAQVSVSGEPWASDHWVKRRQDTSQRFNSFTFSSSSRSYKTSQLQRINVICSFGTQRDPWPRPPTHSLHPPKNTKQKRAHL